MPITAENCMTWILEQVPTFRPSWESHQQWWGDEEPGLGNNVAAFSKYIIDIMKGNRVEGLKSSLVAVERLLNEGNDDVRTAVATNCLENIINRATNGEIPLEAFIQHLGKKSRAYCIEWDRFTGAPTPGLIASEEEETDKGESS